MDRKIPWPRIAVEGIAIVASILLAFSIDAWWGETQRKNAEQVFLQTLLDDLQVKQVLLADMNRFCEAISESAETLLRVAAGTEQKPGEETIDRLIVDTFWVSNEALWDSAPLNLLDAGGSLSLVSNPELVQELAALEVAIGRVTRHYRSDRDFHQNILTPYMIANANMAQISASMTHRPGNPEITITFPDLGFSTTYTHSELLSSVEFQNILVAKMERLSDILDVGHPGVDEHIVKAIGLLEDELGR